jgi:hypothetical protein
VILSFRDLLGNAGGISFGRMASMCSCIASMCFTAIMCITVQESAVFL